MVLPVSACRSGTVIRRVSVLAVGFELVLHQRHFFVRQQHRPAQHQHLAVLLRQHLDLIGQLECGGKRSLGRLKTRPREKARVCYLIFLMGETLPKPDREKWKGDIMNLLGIDDAYYNSKYKEPVSDFPSDSNQVFAKEMRSIFR